MEPPLAPISSPFSSPPSVKKRSAKVSNMSAQRFPGRSPNLKMHATFVEILLKNDYGMMLYGLLRIHKHLAYSSFSSTEMINVDTMHPECNNGPFYIVPFWDYVHNNTTLHNGFNARMLISTGSLRRMLNLQPGFLLQAL
jgi:hypothetical protein